MIFTHKKWQKPVTLDDKRPLIITIQNTNELYQFQNEILNQIETKEGDFCFFDNDKPLKFESQVELITNPLTLSLNSRKAITYLHKQLKTEISLTDGIIQFEELKKSINEFLKSVKNETLINFTFEENLEPEDIFKLLSVRFIEYDETPAVLLSRYLELLTIISKIKVVIILFPIFLFTEDEINNLIEQCIQLNIYLVLLEKTVPTTIKSCNIIRMVDFHIFDDNM